VFRLTKACLAVKFGNDGHALLFTMPAGADVSLLGSSVILGRVEIVCNDEHLHIFEEDLRGRASSGREAMSLRASNRSPLRAGRRLHAV
jgi:hypothetical protein